MVAPVSSAPVSQQQFQGWASFYGGNVQAPSAPPPSVWGSAALGQPPSNGQYTGGWAYPDAWANFYEGKQGFQSPQNQNSPSGALAASYYAQNTQNPNDPNLLGWEQAYGNPNTVLQQDKDWAKSLGAAPTGLNTNQLSGGWQNPEAWAAFYGGTNGFTAPANAGSPASALAAAAQISQTSNPQSNPALLGWVQDFGQPGSVLANTPNWAASLGNPAVDKFGTDIGQTNSQGWTSPLAWAAFYGGFQGFNSGKPQFNNLQTAQNWAGVKNLNDPSLLGWELDYGNPQTVISAIQANPQYQQYAAKLDAFDQQQALKGITEPGDTPQQQQLAQQTLANAHNQYTYYGNLVQNQMAAIQVYEQQLHDAEAAYNAWKPPPSGDPHAKPPPNPYADSIQQASNGLAIANRDFETYQGLQGQYYDIINPGKTFTPAPAGDTTLNLKPQNFPEISAASGVIQQGNDLANQAALNIQAQTQQTLINQGIAYDVTGQYQANRANSLLQYAANQAAINAQNNPQRRPTLYLNTAGLIGAPGVGETVSSPYVTFNTPTSQNGQIPFGTGNSYGSLSPLFERQFLAGGTAAQYGADANFATSGIPGSGTGNSEGLPETPANIYAGDTSVISLGPGGGGGQFDFGNTAGGDMADIPPEVFSSDEWRSGNFTNDPWAPIQQAFNDYNTPGGGWLPADAIATWNFSPTNQDVYGHGNLFTNTVPYARYLPQVANNLVYPFPVTTIAEAAPPPPEVPEPTFANFDFAPSGNGFTPVDDLGRPIPDIGGLEPFQFQIPNIGELLSPLITNNLPTLQLPPTWDNPIGQPQVQRDLAFGGPPTVTYLTPNTIQEFPNNIPQGEAVALTQYGPIGAPAPPSPAEISFPGESSLFVGNGPGAGFGSYAVPTAPIDTSGVPSAPANVFANPLGEGDLYQQGYGEPVYQPPEALPESKKQTAAERFVERMGTSPTLSQLAERGGSPLGSMQLSVLGEKEANTPLNFDTTPEAFQQQIMSMWPSLGPTILERMQAPLTQQGITMQQIADAASDIRQDVAEGPGAYGQIPGNYTTVPIKGPAGIPVTDFSGQPGLPPGLLAPMSDWGNNPTGIRPPGDIPVSQVRAGYNYPSGALSGPDALNQAGYNFPAGSFGEVPYPDLLPPVQPPDYGFGAGYGGGPAVATEPGLPEMASNEPSFSNRPIMWSDEQEAAQQATDNFLINTVLSRGLNLSYPQLIQLGADIFGPYLRPSADYNTVPYMGFGPNAEGYGNYNQGEVGGGIRSEPVELPGYGNYDTNPLGPYGPGFVPGVEGYGSYNQGALGGDIRGIPPDTAQGYGSYNQGEVGGDMRGVPPQDTQYAYPVGPQDPRAEAYGNLVQQIPPDVAATASSIFDPSVQGGPLAGAPGQDQSYTEATPNNWAAYLARMSQIYNTGSVSEIDPSEGFNYYERQGIRPGQVAKANINTPFGKLTVSADAASDFQNFFQTLADNGFPTGPQAGSLNERQKFPYGGGAITDSTPLSHISEHAWGAAVDINNDQTLTDSQIAWIASHPDLFQDALQDNNISWGHAINLKFGPDNPHMEWNGPTPAGTYPAQFGGETWNFPADQFNPEGIRPPANIPQGQPVDLSQTPPTNYFGPNQSSPSAALQTPEAVAAFNSVGANLGVDPAALAMVAMEESGGKTTATTGTYKGLFQQNEGGGVVPFQSLGTSGTAAQQIQNYQNWWNSYGITQQLQSIGLQDLSMFNVPQQAALIQAFQFAPNWAAAIVMDVMAGTGNRPATTSRQAADLGNTSFNAMYQAYLPRYVGGIGAWTGR